MAGDGVERFKLLTPADLHALPEPSWLVEGILPANALAVLYGPPSSYKTFLALSLAGSIAAGHNWCGNPTKAGSVLYVAAEGLRGFRLRLPAYERVHGITVEKRIRFLADGLDLREEFCIERLLFTLEYYRQEENFVPDLIVLDTLARLIPGADENSSQDMGRAVAAMDRLRRANGSTILLVHHTGKDGESERGSSALRGAADVMIKCSAAGRAVTLNCNKMKDAEPFPAMRIGLELIDIDSSFLSLAVANWQQAADPRSVQNDPALETLKKFESATHDEWLDAYKKDTGLSKSTFERAIKGLKANGMVRQERARYYADQGEESVRCHPVSTGCHDTSAVGVMSPPPLGGDTDTAAPGQK